MFRPDSRLIRFLTRACDLLFLNIALVLSCCTVVLSGAAVTALYSVTLKMVREEDDDTPVKAFLRTLRENFVPSTFAAVLLLADVTLLAVLRAVLYADTLLIPPAAFVLLSIAAVFLAALLSYLFPLLARYENTFLKHLGNAAKLAVANLPVTILVTAVNLLPLLLVLLIPAALGVVFAFWFLFGFAAGAWVNSFYLNRIFERREGS